MLDLDIFFGEGGAEFLPEGNVGQAVDGEEVGNVLDLLEFLGGEVVVVAAI